MIPKSVSPDKRCVNIDWLEVYCLEDATVYPCDADYFREKGYWVEERDYGTRTYKEMFVIFDKENQPWIEVRRNPASGDASFQGLVPESCHLRLSNRQCYYDDCIERLRQFLLLHHYIFKRIFRIDICYDFEYFDSGDKPAQFARRFIERRYRKINQCKLRVVGDDNWNDFDWESLAWGSHGSMVSTKLYNKSKEIAAVSREKTWIPWSWFESGLTDDPINGTKMDDRGEPYTPEIWRVEFSLKSSADSWIVFEDVSGKKIEKVRHKHTLSMFDTKEKLWNRFEELAYHYFRFKHREFKKSYQGLTKWAHKKVHADIEEQLQRKDRCTDKVLFHFNKNREFCHLSQVPKADAPARTEIRLRKYLEEYKLYSGDMKVREACEAIIDAINNKEIRRFTPHGLFAEIGAIQLAIATRTGLPYEVTKKMAEKIKEDFELKLMF